MTLFNVGAIFSKSIQTVLPMGLFRGKFGASPSTNTGCLIADIFNASQRGLAMNFFAVTPFMGLVLGPIVRAFLGEAAGWKWVTILMAVFCATLWVISILVVPETFAPVLLRKRVDKPSHLTGKFYVCHFDVRHGGPTLKVDLKVSLTRPWMLLVREPIVFIITIYISIIYGSSLRHQAVPPP